MNAPPPNTIYPGRPGYTGPTRGLFGLLHHDGLYEWSDAVMERVNYTRTHKPSHQCAIRLHCMVYLNPAGQPWEEGYRLWKEGYHLREKSNRLWKESNRLWKESNRLWKESNRLRKESNRLWKESDRLQGESNRLSEGHRTNIEALILTLVPDAPWDGHQLVFNDGGNQ